MIVSKGITGSVSTEESDYWEGRLPHVKLSAKADWKRDELEIESLKSLSEVSLLISKKKPEGFSYDVTGLMKDDSAQFLGRDPTLVKVIFDELDEKKWAAFRKGFDIEEKWVLTLETVFFDRYWLVDREGQVLDYRKKTAIIGFS